MSSSVYFRFKSQKEPTRVTFDGTGISVFELKRDIITMSRLGDGTDFELIILAEDTNEVYDEDTAIVPRSTTVIAKRLPASKPGRGGAARYVSGRMPVNAKSSHRAEMPSKVTPPNRATNATDRISDITGETEEERIAAMFKSGADQWAQTQQEMANATPIHRASAMKNKSANVPDHPPPEKYTCYRCGEKGHWIMECPTNDDPEWQNRPRVKRTTGIPRSFLRPIEKPAALSNDGTHNDTKQPAGTMVNADGNWVVFEPDKASWEKYQAKTKASAAAQEAAVRGSKELQEKGLECSIDKRLFLDPTKTPCCNTTYCNECITNALLDNELQCPGCATTNVLIDDLTPDTDMAAKIRVYEEETINAKKEKENSKSPVIKREGSQSQSPDASRTVTPEPTVNENSKKRSADEELENKRIPLGPKAEIMSKKSSGQDSQQPSSTPAPGALPNGSLSNQTSFMNGAFMPQAGLNLMDFSNMNGFMNMPMSMPMSLAPMMAMSPAMPNPMMMPPGPFMGGNMGGWNSGAGFAFPQQGNGMYGVGNFQNGMIPNGGYGQTNVSGNMQPGMNRPGQNGQGMRNFANQQRTTFSTPRPSEEDSAYFRKPVNPHRHQGRRNVHRPTDYREV